MTLISPDEAWRRIDARISPLAGTAVARRAAVGGVLAQDLAATVDVPASDVSAMDGYAVAGEVRSGDLRAVAGTVAAGSLIAPQPPARGSASLTVARSDGEPLAALAAAALEDVAAGA